MMSLFSQVGLTAMTHGWRGLATGYVAIEAPMLTGLIRGRAALRQFLASPVVALPLTAVAALGMASIAPLLADLGMGADSVFTAMAGAALFAGVGYTVGKHAARPRAAVPRHQRGAIVYDATHRSGTRSRTAAKGRTAMQGDTPVRLAGIDVQRSDETKHFKFIGTTGTGKSTAIRELLGSALDRGDRAVIADPDGGYVDRFYDAKRGDIILNPFDPRSLKWDLFGEIRCAYDVEQIARSLIPDHDGPDRSWRAYARTFLGALTRQAHAAGTRDIGELYRLTVLAGTTELRTLVGGTPAQPFLEEHNGRMFDSIRSVASSAVGALEHVAAQSAPAFSIRQWMAQSSEQRGVLFIPYQAGQIAALRSTISAWMRIAIFECMQQREGDQRLWFVVDELDALGQIDGLKDALARLRKFGGRCVLGFQSIAQVATTYGAGEAHTIVENCGNSLILRCSTSEGGGTSQFASQLIGQREVLRTTQSTSRRFTELFGATTRSEHINIEAAVMDSEIEQLPDLMGYLKFSSRDHWLKIVLPADTHVARDSAQRTVPDATPTYPSPMAPRPVATSAPQPPAAAQLHNAAVQAAAAPASVAAAKGAVKRPRRAPAARAKPTGRSPAAGPPRVKERGRGEMDR